MAWTIKLAFAVLLTSLTGSIVLLVWNFIGKGLEWLGYLDIRYSLLKLVLVFFVLPICYLMITWIVQIWSEWDGGVLFLQTPALLRGCSIFCAVWFAGIGIFGSWYLLLLTMLRKRYRGKIMECSEDEIQEFLFVCDMLGIPPGQVEVWRNYGIVVAELTGIRHPAVMIPVEKYTGEDLRTIFVHELIHYKQKDIWIKHAVTIILIFHFFNPVVWWLHFSIRRWSEHACDRKACEHTGGMDSYFDTITEMVTDVGTVKAYFTVQQVEDEHQLLERVVHMKKFIGFQKKSPVAAAVVCGVLVAVSSVTVCAASAGMAGQYRNFYQASVVEEVENMDIMELEEFEETPGIGTSVEEEGELQEMVRSIATFAWTVSGNVLKKTPEFDAKSGGSISVTAVAPADKYVNVGIIEPDGMKRYVREKGDIYHEFALDQTGKYRVFVENKNAGAVDVEGSYIVR